MNWAHRRTPYYIGIIKKDFGFIVGAKNFSPLHATPHDRHFLTPLPLFFPSKRPLFRFSRVNPITST